MILPIDKNLIPYRFEIELNNEIFTFEVHHNQRYDYFTIDLYKNDVPLVYGEKLVLNISLFDSLVNVDLPQVKIIPKDRANMASRITYDNMGETVFLFVE